MCIKSVKTNNVAESAYILSLKILLSLKNCELNEDGLVSKRYFFDYIIKGFGRTTWK